MTAQFHNKYILHTDLLTKLTSGCSKYLMQENIKITKTFRCRYILKGQLLSCLPLAIPYFNSKSTQGAILSQWSDSALQISPFSNCTVRVN